jgi:hypothetical protein
MAISAEKLSDKEIDAMYADLVAKKPQAAIPADSLSDEEIDKKYLELVAKKPPVQQEFNEFEAGLQGLGSGATMGYLPAIQGMTEQGLFKLFNAVTGQDIQPDPVNVAIQSYIDREKELKKQHPKTMLGGQIAGGLVAAPVIAAALPEVGAGATGAIGTGALTGGIMGAVQAPEVDKPEDYLDPTKRLEGAGIGSLAGGAMGGLGVAASKAAPAIKDFAAKHAFQATLPVLKNVPEDLDKVEQIGRVLLEEKVISPDKLKFWNPLSWPSLGTKKLEVVQKEIEDKLDDTGRRLGSIIKSVSESSGEDLRINRQDIMDRLIINAQDLLPPTVSGYEQKQAKLIDEIGKVIKNYPKVMSVEYANDQKKKVGKALGDAWRHRSSADSPLQELNNKSLYFALNESIMDIAGKAQGLAGQTMADELKKNNKIYSALSAASDTINDRLRRDMANRLVSPSDYGVGTVAAAATMMKRNDGDVSDAAIGTIVGMGAAAINNFARRYGDQLMANSAYFVANTLDKNPALKKPFEGYIASLPVSDPRVMATGLVSLMDSLNFLTVPGDVKAILKQEVIKDLSLSNIEKSKVLQKINKEGRVDVPVFKKIMGNKVGAAPTVSASEGEKKAQALQMMLGK